MVVACHVQQGSVKYIKCTCRLNIRDNHVYLLHWGKNTIIFLLQGAGASSATPWSILFWHETHFGCYEIEPNGILRDSSAMYFMLKKDWYNIQAYMPLPQPTIRNTTVMLFEKSVWSPLAPFAALSAAVHCMINLFLACSALQLKSIFR